MWGEAVSIRRKPYTRTVMLTYSSQEYAGTDSKGRAQYRTKTSVWPASVPCISITFAIRGDEGGTIAAVYDREGDAHATGHHSHYTTQPSELEMEGGREKFPGRLTDELDLVM